MGSQYLTPCSGAASGIDMNSEELSELADHPNCFGVKVNSAHRSSSHALTRPPAHMR
jgi:dihydrodipicolinate synthase/N-acetylneuraminate lyase